MQFIKRLPGVGYLDNWLWLPKTHVSQTQIESAFTFEGPKIVEAWHAEEHHFRVPRNYLAQETLEKMPFQVFDLRSRRFPRVHLKSSVVLDYKEPHKDYQRRGSAALLETFDGILCLRCGAGKTVVGLHSAAQLNVPVIITVTDEGLAEQWVEEIVAHLGVPESDIGMIGGKRAKGKMNWEHAIAVAHVQTLARRQEEGLLPPEMLNHFGLLICDEAHVMGAPYFNTAIPPFRGRRWGLSATPVREDGYDPLLRYTLGPVVYTYLTPDLIPKVYFRQLPTRLDLDNPKVVAETHDATGQFHYGMTYGYLSRERKDRTERIVKDIQDGLDSGRQILVLTHSKDMTDVLGSYFPGAGVVNGEVKGQERRRRIRECNPVIAIMQLGKQALNKPSLDTLYVLEPFSKAGMLQQTMGRVLRLFAGKKNPLVIFFEDIGIRPMSRLCGKLRMKLNRWPAAKGGQIPHTTVKPS
jgi:superfamily II DNA or RNA helicase